MTDEVRIEYIGFDKLARALDKADELFLPLASKAIAISLTAIREPLEPYPPQPDRMRSGHLNTYVRGQGNYPKSAFIPDSSEPGGFRTKRVKKSSIKLTSQQMDKSFTQKVKVTKNAIVGELGNDATYSGYVIGPEDEDGDPHQVAFHAQTGWTSTDDAIEAATPTIMDSMNLAINEFVSKLAGN